MQTHGSGTFQILDAPGAGEDYRALVALSDQMEVRKSG